MSGAPRLMRGSRSQRTSTRRPPARDRLAPRSLHRWEDSSDAVAIESMHTSSDLGRASLSDMPPADQRASEAQERVVQAGVAFPADAEPAEVVQPGERSFHHPAHAAESRAVVGAAAGDPRFHASAPQLPTVLVVVVAAIGDHAVRSLARPATFARDGADPVDEGEQLRDVVAMSTGQRCAQRDAVTVDDQVVLGTGAGTIDWRMAGQRTTAKRADVAAVYYPGRPVEPAEGVESPEQLPMQPIPDAGFLPVTH